MKTSFILSLLLTTYVLAVQPATAVKTETASKAVVPAKTATVKTEPATDSKAQAATAPAQNKTVADSSAKATATPAKAEQAKTEPVKTVTVTDSKAAPAPANAPAKENAVVDSSAKAAPATANTPTKETAVVDSSAKAAPATANTPTKETAVVDSSAKAAPATANAPAKETAVVDSSAKTAPAQEIAAIDTSKTKAATPAKKKVKKVRKVKAKKAPLITAGAFKFDMNSEFEIQAGKVLWTSEDDINKDNMEEWFGRANIAFFTQSEDFDGKIRFSIYPGDLLEDKTVVANSENQATTQVRDVIELSEAWAWQRTKYINFKLGRWENTDKHGDYFGGYIDGYVTGFKSAPLPENMIQFGVTPTENLSINLALISTGPKLNTGDLRIVANFRQLSSIEALDIDLGLRTNIFDKVNDDKKDVRTNISLKVNVPLIEDKLFLFGEVAMLGLGADSTETYFDDKNILKERDVVIDWTMPLTGGIMMKSNVIDRIILEAEYIADRRETEYHTNTKHIKDVLGAFYIEKDLTSRFTLSAGFHSFDGSKDWVINGNLIGRIN